MDGVSVAANIVGIATAGVALSIKLVTLATQISTASERVSSIGNDISLTSGVLYQLGELMTQKTTDDGISIFSQGGLETTKTSAAVCERIFQEVDREIRKASEQIRGAKRLDGGKVKLSRIEKAKWPFLQPSVDALRADLREAKGTLMLMLQVTSLALSKRMADFNHSASRTMLEQRDFMRAIVALEQQQREPYPNSRALRKSSTLFNDTRSLKSEALSSHISIDSLSSAEELHAPSLAEEGHSNSTGSKASTPRNDLNCHTKATGAMRKLSNPSQQHSNKAIYPSETTASPKMSANLAEFPFTALNAMQISGSNSINDSSSTLWSQPSKSELSSSQGPTQRHDPYLPDKLSSDLQLFLLKPIVKDYFDKIELSWYVQNTKMQEPAIRRHMEKDEKDGVPSVIDMLESLHAYEQKLIDIELAKRESVSEGSLLSLRRTKTVIRHRDITITDVPGLQFVVERSSPRTIAPPVKPPKPSIMKFCGAKFKFDGETDEDEAAYPTPQGTKAHDRLPRSEKIRKGSPELPVISHDRIFDQADKEKTDAIQEDDKKASWLDLEDEALEVEDLDLISIDLDLDLNLDLGLVDEAPILLTNPPMLNSDDLLDDDPPPPVADPLPSLDLDPRLNDGPRSPATYPPVMKVLKKTMAKKVKLRSAESQPKLTDKHVYQHEPLKEERSSRLDAGASGLRQTSGETQPVPDSMEPYKPRQLRTMKRKNCKQLSFGPTEPRFLSNTMTEESRKGKPSPVRPDWADDNDDDDDDEIGMQENKRTKITPEAVHLGEDVEEDALVVDLLEKYTTLFA